MLQSFLKQEGQGSCVVADAEVITALWVKGGELCVVGIPTSARSDDTILVRNPDEANAHKTSLATAALYLSRSRNISDSLRNELILFHGNKMKPAALVKAMASEQVVTNMRSLFTGRLDEPTVNLISLIEGTEEHKMTEKQANALLFMLFVNSAVHVKASLNKQTRDRTSYG